MRSYFKKIKIKKGFWKDPSFYFGAFSAILFVVFYFGAGPILKPILQGEDFSFLASASESFDNINIENIDNQSLFVSQETKISSPNLNLIQGNSLREISSPSVFSFQVLGSLIDSESSLNSEVQQDSESKEIIEYVVQTEDTLLTISQKFGISLNTILWANNLQKNSAIQPNQKLIILPVSGILYYVKKGDTLSEIAKTYKGEIDEIISFNELSGENNIYIGDILVIPNGTMPALVKPLPSPFIPLASSYFICPIPSPCKITQGLHWANAVDFSNGKCGDLIYAAAEGEVLKIKYGWNRGAGNYLTILHPNAAVTSYGHLQKILVVPGQVVSQGDVIALMGGQPGTPGAGRSTGCHVHFGVQGTRNPFAK